MQIHFLITDKMLVNKETVYWSMIQFIKVNCLLLSEVGYIYFFHYHLKLFFEKIRYLSVGYLNYLSRCLIGIIYR